MVVPSMKYPFGHWFVTPGSVSRLAITDGPSAACCVDVKPRNSSARSGMEAAPGIFASTAICLVRLRPPAPILRPSTNPRRMLVIVIRFPGGPWKMASKADSMWSRWSLANTKATSFCSRIVPGGSLAKAMASKMAKVVSWFAWLRAMSTGSQTLVSAVGRRPKYGSPQATARPRPDGRKSSRPESSSSPMTDSRTCWASWRAGVVAGPVNSAVTTV
jgi:hypothetical protein